MRPVWPLFLLMLVALTGVARANGAYIPSARVTSTPPTIPMQTALIRHEDGVQTLIVESAAAGAEGDNFAWLLPLPAAPTSMEPAGASTLTSLRALVGKRIVADTPSLPLVFLTMGWLGTISLIFVRRQFLPPGQKPRHSVLEWTVIFAIMLFLAAIAVPNFLGDHVTSRSAGVDVLAEEAVGSYDVTVLKATGVAELEAWLAGNGYAALGAGRAAAAGAYIQEGWIFLAMKIRRAAGEALEPHPLRVTFPTPAPVFPMRLTAAPGQTTDVAIFLIGPVPYTHPLFRTEIRKRVNRQQWEREMDGAAVVNVSIGRADLIAIPDFIRFVKHNDWVTRLQATLNESQMREDIHPVALPADMPEMQQTVYTPMLVRLWVFQSALAMAFIMAPVAAWMVANRRLRPAGVLLLVVPIAATAAFVHFAHPRADNFRVHMPYRSVQPDEVVREIRKAERKAEPLATPVERRQYMTRTLATQEEYWEGRRRNGYTAGKGPMQYYFAHSEARGDVLRFVLGDGSVAEYTFEELIAPPDADENRQTRPQ